MDHTGRAPRVGARPVSRSQTLYRRKEQPSVTTEKYPPNNSGAVKHPLHGIVNEEIERPLPEVIARLGDHNVSQIADAMGGNGLMSYTVKPISPGMKLCGPAVTVLGRPGDVLYVIRATDVAQPGDVIVINGGSVPDLAMIGDGIGYYMQRHRGIAGVVVDGGVRDVKGLREMGFATFATGGCARIHGAYGPGAINVPISCGQTAVTPGDIIVGDDDGVVVVPAAQAEAIADATDRVLAGEMRRRELVDRGANLTELRDLEPLLALWRRSTGA